MKQKSGCFKQPTAKYSAISNLKVFKCWMLPNAFKQSRFEFFKNVISTYYDVPEVIQDTNYYTQLLF